MTSGIRLALRELIAALEHHHEMTRNADVVTDAVLEDAEARLQDAFFTYDDLLFTEWEVELPLELVDDYDEDDEEEVLDEDFDEDIDDDDEDDDDFDEDLDDDEEDDLDEDGDFEEDSDEGDEDAVGGNED